MFLDRSVILDHSIMRLRILTTNIELRNRRGRLSHSIIISSLNGKLSPIKKTGGFHGTEEER
jgi:hypothetical protein